MYTITEKNSPLEDGNKVLGGFPRLENSKIIFDGAGNVLCCEPGVHLKNSSIEFCGDNSLVSGTARKETVGTLCGAEMQATA